MNITEFMDFDFGWFLTLPGMLITGGVVVLLIALIIFIASNKKDKKKNAEVASDYNNGGGLPVSDNMMQAQGGVPLDNMAPMMGMPMNNDMSMNNMGAQVPSFGTDNMNGMGNMEMGASVASINTNNTFGSIAGDNGTMTPSSSIPSYDTTAQSVVTPTNVVDFSAPVQPTVNENVTIPSVENTMGNNEAPSFNAGSLGQESSVVPSVSPMSGMPIESVTTPMADTIIPTTQGPETFPSMGIDSPVMNGMNVPNEGNTSMAQQASSTVPERPSIYGGVDPMNTVTAKEEVKPVIYGGANPLENTTTIPVMTHEAYNMSAPIAQPNVSEVEPITTTIGTPSYNQMVETPAVADTFVAPAPVVPEVPVASTPVVPAMPEVMPSAASPVMASPMPNSVSDSVMPSTMPMTGAEMFGSIDNGAPVSAPASDGNEIETLEF